ncbi:MAG TPA: nicotinate-nicotinamide nucleotide adenylyltransferase, partial [Blastocatellia bacterium]|nr:nicotinate-nicotinamide nucleotide adenylyltransferase [Blastocatellia bacterium]
NPAATKGSRLGVFASSFNPPTIAHIELIRRAAEAFSLDEVLALASKANADKLDYECSLEDRLAMVMLAFADEPLVSIGLSSHAFYVDMVEALGPVYEPTTDVHFIVGFDTFERVLDFDDRYTERYHLHFTSRRQALDYLFARSIFIVASRAGAGLSSVKLLLEREPAVPPEKVLYLDFPGDLGDVSATDVRERRRGGLATNGLVPAAVQRYIEVHELYVT